MQQHIKQNSYFKEPYSAFMLAINECRLTEEEAPSYMYMGTWGGRDQFKNVVTRQYLE